MFDLDTAIATRLDAIPQSEKDRFQKIQEEKRAELKKSLEKFSGNSVFGKRMVDLAFENLCHGDDDFEYTRMAEGFYLLGDVESAYKTTKDPAKKEYYKRVMDAPDMECTHGAMTLLEKLPTFTLLICPKCRHLRKC